MGATTIVDVITGADAAVTVAVDAATAVDAEPVFLAAVPPAAAFSGSSFFFAHAAATVLAATTAVATEMVTAAGSLSSFCFSAVDGGMAAAADLSFPHMKKGCLLSPFQKIGTAGNFPCPLFQAYSKSILTFPCFFFNHALGRNSLLQIVFNPRYGLRTAFFLLTAPHTCHFLPVFLASFAHIPDPARIWHFHL